MTHEQRAKAAIIYCEGVKQDFPETSVWMNSIIEILRDPPKDGLKEKTK